MKRLLVQMGSFNPLHRMHKKIADNAIHFYPDHTHTFCMAIETCDKGENSIEELERRSRAIEDQGYNARYTKSGMFIDVIKELRAVDPGTHTHIVFPVGEDTMYRFFRDWDKYYNEHHPDQYLKRYEDYREAFKDVEWYVSRRECPERDLYDDRFKEYMHHYDNTMWSTLDLDDISSTKIRAGEVENE
jgi:nicotinic acid mononucleotide adenylyltransferase